MKQALVNGMVPAMESRLALLEGVLIPEGSGADDLIVIRLRKVSKSLHSAGKAIVQAYRQTPGADIGQTIAALDALEDVRTKLTKSLLMPSVAKPNGGAPPAASAASPSASVPMDVGSSNPVQFMR
jgi:hypothetical protein